MSFFMKKYWMNSNKNLEIPLLSMNPKDSIPKPKQYTNIQNEKNHSRSYKSHFSDLLRYTHDSKFTRYLSFLDRFFYFDAYRLILEYNKAKKNFTLDDLPSPYYEYNSEIYLEKLDRYWNFEVKNKENISMIMAIFKTFKWNLLITLTIGLAYIILRFFYIYLMGNIINFITQKNIIIHNDNNINETNVDPFGINQRYMILYQTLAMILCMLCSSILGHYVYFRNYSLGIILKLSFICMMYKKIHTISLNSLNQLNVGKVINLAANDFNELGNAFLFFSPMILSPFVILGASFMLWNHFGVISLAGIIILTLIIPLQYLLTALMKPYKSQKNNATDERIRLTNEIIECIRLIKMYAWELPIQYIIEKLRLKELGFIKKIYLYDAIGRTITNNSVYFTSFILFLTYIIAGGELSPQKVYTTITILEFVKQQGLLFFLLGRTHFINTMLNFNRIKEILLIPDILSIEETSYITQIYDGNMIPSNNLLSKSMSTSIKSDQNFENQCKISVIMEDFTGFWNHILNKPCLKDINLQVKPNTLVAVIGKIGSGKTSFLLNFLRELPKTQGNFECHGKLAYVEQEPYIFEGTLKDNILFGNMLNQSFYDYVLEITSLKDDLISLPNRDDTLIGEKGTTLSGGQRSRVSLARAIYSQSDIYLLDDPLSAVDAKVAKIIFNKAIKGYLCKDRIVFLVTHHLHFVKEADHIILLDNGQIESQGPYSEIIQKNIDYMSIFPTEKGMNFQATATTIYDDYSTKKRNNMKYIDSFHKGETSFKVVKAKMFELEDKDNVLVTKQTYLEYIKNSGGFWLFSLLIMVFIVHEIINLAYNRYIGYWAYLHEDYYNSNKDIMTVNNDDIQTQNYYYIKLIGIFLVVSICLALIKNLSLNYMSMLSSENLHNQLLNRIFKAKIRFFDLNPIGRIINRFSDDIGVLDLLIFRTIYDSIDGLIFNGSLILTISYANFYILSFALIIMYGINKCKNHFEDFLLEARKLDLITKSPIYSQISSTINGLIVIRAYNQGARFIMTFLENIYNSNKASILYIRAIRSFGICLDLLIQLFTSLSILFFVIYSLVYNVESGLFGMILLYLIQFAERFEWTIRQITMLNVHMTSTQRIIEYTNIPIENYNSPNNKLSKPLLNKPTWPTSGDIQFNNVYMKYDESIDIFALKGLTFNIKSGERIGCIGRTGAGKSSIIQALFKMVEIETKPGSFIKIDGVDIKDIDLHVLRSNLAIIPQNAVIFNGSIRRNLDPLNMYSDELIWKALEDVNLKEMIMKLEKRLDTDMTISNSVFSVGQKQLICLARIILRQSKIIILDEATANLDLETDNFIQLKIKELFKDCTMITIAHRLTTIADYDKVLVIDQGKVIENDHPYRLFVKNIGDNTITNLNSEFAKMVLNLGLIMSRTIFKIAKQAYFEKHYNKLILRENNLNVLYQ